MSHKNEVDFAVIAGSSDFIIENLAVTQTKIENSQKDLKNIQEELFRLRNEMMKEARTDQPEHFEQMGMIATAEKAAAKGDEEGVKKAFKGIGKWTFDIATKIGASLVASLISQHLKE